MKDWLLELCGGSYMPHGQCFLWNPVLIWLHVVADGFIALAYYSIPITLVYFVRKGKDVAYPTLFLMFAAFIVACGTTHVMAIVDVWHAAYWWTGVVKLLTATISVITAVALVRIMPRALELPSRKELSAHNDRLEARVRERTAALTAANGQLRLEITQREQAESEVRRLNQALELQVAELRALFDALPVGVGISRDASCREIRTNRTFANVLGIQPEANASLSALDETAPATFRIFAAGRELAAHELPMQRAVRENRAIHDFEETIRRKDGTETQVTVTALPLRDEHGQATGVVATFHDITARKAAEDELRLVIEAAPNALIKVDAQGTIAFANSQTLAMFGYARDELIGQSIEQLIPERFRSSHGRQLAGFFAAPSTRAMGAGRDLYGRRKDGSEVPIEIGLNPIHTPRGKMVLAAIIDLTHRKRAEQERIEFERRLLETQKLESIGVLAGGIAHDFNNLLTAVLGNASLVRNQLPAEQTTMQRQLQEVERAAERAAELCRQLLAYAGQGNFVIQPTDLNSVIRSHLPLVQLSLSKLVSLHLDLAEPLRLVSADESQLRQVIMNLLINAAEAIGDRLGQIALRTRLEQIGPAEIALLVAPHSLAPGWFVLLEVEDDGTGMSPETVTRIFEPFFTTKFIGRGLGLAALIGIMRRHHGGIRVDSAPGRGTRFQLLFPALEDSATPFPRDSGAPFAPARGRGTVLVVDDEAYVRSLARDALEGAGYDVVLAVDGADAISLIRATPARFVAVLLDLSMPKLDGHGTLLALRVLAPRLPVLLTSGHSQQKISQRFLPSSLAGFLPKPFTAARLLSGVAAAIRAARSAN